MMASQILDRPIDEHASLVDPRNRRHERPGTGRQHNSVVGNFDGSVGHDNAARAVDLAGAVANVDLDAVIAIPIQPRDGELARIAVSEIGSQVDAVVGRPGLLAESHQPVGARLVEFD